MMRFSILHALSVLPVTLAHMQMLIPSPLRDPHSDRADEPKDYNILTPLHADGSDFACKGYQYNTPWTTVATYEAGGTYNVTLKGGATHGGGSCQLSLACDGGEQFKVIKSIIGGCPLELSYEFTVPSELGSLHGGPAQCLFAWTWFNKIGNREMYMNCAVVEITPPTKRSSVHGSNNKRSRSKRAVAHANAAAQTALSSYPDLFVANLASINNCVIKETFDVVFNDPGKAVEYGDGLDASDRSSFTSDCTGLGRLTAGSATSSTSTSSSSGSSGQWSASSSSANSGQWQGSSASSSSSSSSSGNSGQWQGSSSGAGLTNQGSSTSSINYGDGMWHPELWGDKSASSSSSTSSSTSSNGNSNSNGNGNTMNRQMGSSDNDSDMSDMSDMDTSENAAQQGNLQPVDVDEQNDQPDSDVETALNSYLATLYGTSGSSRSKRRASMKRRDTPLTLATPAKASVQQEGSTPTTGDRSQDDADSDDDQRQIENDSDYDSESSYSNDSEEDDQGNNENDYSEDSDDNEDDTQGDDGYDSEFDESDEDEYDDYYGIGRRASRRQRWAKYKTMPRSLISNQSLSGEVGTAASGPPSPPLQGPDHTSSFLAFLDRLNDVSSAVFTLVKFASKYLDHAPPRDAYYNPDQSGAETTTVEITTTAPATSNDTLHNPALNATFSKDPNNKETGQLWRRIRRQLVIPGIFPTSLQNAEDWYFSRFKDSFPEVWISGDDIHVVPTAGGSHAKQTEQTSAQDTDVKGDDNEDNLTVAAPIRKRQILNGWPVVLPQDEGDNDDSNYLPPFSDEDSDGTITDNDGLAADDSAESVSPEDVEDAQEIDDPLYGGIVDTEDTEPDSDDDGESPFAWDTSPQFDGQDSVDFDPTAESDAGFDAPQAEQAPTDPTADENDTSFDDFTSGPNEDSTADGDDRVTGSLTDNDDEGPESDSNGDWGPITVVHPPLSNDTQSDSWNVTEPTVLVDNPPAISDDAPPAPLNDTTPADDQTLGEIIQILHPEVLDTDDQDSSNEPTKEDDWTEEEGDAEASSPDSSDQSVDGTSSSPSNETEIFQGPIKGLTDGPPEDSDAANNVDGQWLNETSMQPSADPSAEPVDQSVNEDVGPGPFEEASEGPFNSHGLFEEASGQPIPDSTDEPVDDASEEASDEPNEQDSDNTDDQPAQDLTEAPVDDRTADNADNSWQTWQDGVFSNIPSSVDSPVDTLREAEASSAKPSKTKSPKAESTSESDAAALFPFFEGPGPVVPPGVDPATWPNPSHTSDNLESLPSLTNDLTPVDEDQVRKFFSDLKKSSDDNHDDSDAKDDSDVWKRLRNRQLFDALDWPSGSWDDNVKDGDDDNLDDLPPLTNDLSPADDDQVRKFFSDLKDSADDDSNDSDSQLLQRATATPTKKHHKPDATHTKKKHREHKPSAIPTHSTNTGHIWKRLHARQIATSPPLVSTPTDTPSPSDAVVILDTPSPSSTTPASTPTPTISCYQARRVVRERIDTATTQLNAPCGFGANVNSPAPSNPQMQNALNLVCSANRKRINAQLADLKQVLSGSCASLLAYVSDDGSGSR